MNPASKTRSGGRDPKPGTSEVDTRNKKTPGTDMQAEDAGTADSGNPPAASRGGLKQAPRPKAGNRR